MQRIGACKTLKTSLMPKDGICKLYLHYLHKNLNHEWHIFKWEGTLLNNNSHLVTFNMQNLAK